MSLQNVPYDYSDYLDDVNDLPILIAGNGLTTEKNWHAAE